MSAWGKELDHSEKLHFYFQIGIVLTDGQSAHQGRTTVESFRSKMASIHLFAVGIGNNVNKKELVAISTNSEDKLFMVDSYSALGAIKNTLAVRTCKSKSDFC